MRKALPFRCLQVCRRLLGREHLQPRFAVAREPGAILRKHCTAWQLHVQQQAEFYTNQMVSAPRDVKLGKCIGVRQYVFMTIERRAVQATCRRFLSDA